MPLKEADQKTIIRIGKQFGVRMIWVFGSVLDKNAEPNDIDIAVDGIKPEDFYKFYGKLGCALKQQVDLVDMSDDLAIVPVIREKGMVIYGKEQSENERIYRKRKAAS